MDKVNVQYPCKGSVLAMFLNGQWLALYQKQPDQFDLWPPNQALWSDRGVWIFNKCPR